MIGAGHYGGITKEIQKYLILQYCKKHYRKRGGYKLYML